MKEKRRPLRLLASGYGLLKDAALRWVDDGCYRLGAALAYYALFSLFPLLLLCVTVLGFLLGRDASVRQRILAGVVDATSPQFRALLDQTLQGMQEHLIARGVGAIIGLVTLLFGASAVCSELQADLNTIWHVKAPPAPGAWATVLLAVKGKLKSFVIVGAAALVFLASLAVTTIVATLGGTGHASRLDALASLPAELVVSVGFLAFLFAALFKALPNAKVRWRDVIAGAVFTAILFTVLKRALAWYLGHLGGYAAYGAVGAVLSLLLWIYLASLSLFYGAELTRLYAERFGSLSVKEREPGTWEKTACAT
jgi:membrane protein